MLINPPRNLILDWDLYRSPKLLNEMPGLAIAFDAERMAAQLQTALIAGRRADYGIASCELEKLTYLLKENLCTLLYKLQIQNNLTGETESHWVNGWLFADKRACVEFWDACLRPIIEERHAFAGVNRFAPAPFAKPIARLDELNLVVSGFPIDDAMPILSSAIDHQQMQRVLHNLLPASLGKLDKIDVIHYKPHHSCVIRYQMIPQVGIQNGNKKRDVIYGKASHHRGGAQRIEAIVQLRERLQNDWTNIHFNLPRPLGHISELRLTLLGPVPGKPRRIFRLLRKRLGDKRNGKPEALTLEEAIEACAKIGAALHTSGIEMGDGRYLADDLNNLQTAITAIRTHSPEFGKQLQNWLEQLKDVAYDTEPFLHCFSHGDFTYSQLLFDGRKSGLIDFDDICQAEPAFDLGRFLAYLRVAILRIQQSSTPLTRILTSQLRAQFLEAYLYETRTHIVDGCRLQERVFVYEFANLLLMAIRNWQKFKSYRLPYVMTALEEVQTEKNDVYHNGAELHGAYFR